MSRFRAYINPRGDTGDFTGFIEVTEDIDFNSMGTINQQIDNNEFNVGLFRFNEFSLKLRNEHGAYSDVDTLQSIFRTRRAGSQFKLTWSPHDHGPVCGIAVCGASHGASINQEIDVLTGVLNDEATKLDIDDQRVSFRVLSTDSIFTGVETPFSSLNAGDLYSAALLTILNQSSITEYLTVSAVNINVGLDQTLDNVANFENQTVKESLDELLFQSNSVMYIKNQTVFIRSRDGGAASTFTFIGQASNDGIENIKKISDVSTGLNQVFNFWTWDNVNLVASDLESIQANGIRKKSISFDSITNTVKRQEILNAQRTQFKLKKMSFQLTASIAPDMLDITMLDQVRVDYPTTYTPAETDGELPIYGVAVYGQSRYGFGQFSITISKETPMKILGININTKNQELIFKIKEI
ncbi:MAG: hypothetical protein GY861_17840 [bacterium]|nr:hypothetical protein [bacterium]